MNFFPFSFQMIANCKKFEIENKNFQHTSGVIPLVNSWNFFRVSPSSNSPSSARFKRILSNAWVAQAPSIFLKFFFILNKTKLPPKFYLMCKKNFVYDRGIVNFNFVANFFHAETTHPPRFGVFVKKNETKSWAENEPKKLIEKSVKILFFTFENVVANRKILELQPLQRLKNSFIKHHSKIQIQLVKKSNRNPAPTKWKDQDHFQVQPSLATSFFSTVIRKSAAQNWN